MGWALCVLDFPQPQRPGQHLAQVCLEERVREKEKLRDSKEKGFLYFALMKTGYAFLVHCRLLQSSTQKNKHQVQKCNDEAGSHNTKTLM